MSTILTTGEKPWERYTPPSGYFQKYKFDATGKIEAHDGKNWQALSGALFDTSALQKAVEKLQTAQRNSANGMFLFGKIPDFSKGGEISKLRVTEGGMLQGRVELPANTTENPSTHMIRGLSPETPQDNSAWVDIGGINFDTTQIAQRGTGVSAYLKPDAGGYLLQAANGARPIAYARNKMAPAVQPDNINLSSRTGRTVLT